MNLITEDMMKKIIKGGKNIVDGQVRLPLNTVLTPAAQTVLADSKLNLILVDNTIERKDDNKVVENQDYDVMKTADELSAKSIGKFQLENGGFLNEKPEYMTQIFGNQLVFKDHRIIKLRGEVDILISEIMKVQIVATKDNLMGLVEDLQDVCRYIGQLQKCEILNEEMSNDNILNLDSDKIREMSHHPKKYFGKEHLFNITYQLGEMPILINYLRALVRKVEISCYEAFKLEGGGTKRSDLVQAYNRLSSVFYIITFKYLNNHYGNFNNEL